MVCVKRLASFRASETKGGGEGERVETFRLCFSVRRSTERGTNFD